MFFSANVIKVIDGSLYIPEALRPYLGGKDHFDPVA